MKTTNDDPIATLVADTTPREKRTRDGVATTDGRPKAPCHLCGARTRRRDNAGRPECADCYAMTPPRRK